jgi:FtsZ-binding cell division protein ZapB
MDYKRTYRNNICHDNTNQQAAQYNIEALDKRYEEIWEKHADLVERLRAFQTKHFEDS